MPILRQRKPLKNFGFGQAAFPTTSAGSGKLGQDGFYSCKQCGFWNDSSLIESPGGTSEGDGGVTVDESEDPPEPEVGTFCGFCGSANSR